MNSRIVFAITIPVLLACNFLFPIPAAPTEPPTKAALTVTVTQPHLLPTEESVATGSAYTEVRLHPGNGDLNSLLATEAEKATKLGLLPVVEFDATWCPPCQAINKALKDKNELMVKAYSGVYLIKLDVDEWGWNVDGFNFTGIPVYFKLDAQGQRTGEVIDGGAWNEDIPENIAPVMDRFFHTGN